MWVCSVHCRQNGLEVSMQSQEQGHAPVVTCDVMECSYNKNECCCAPSIEVGDQHPACDTFTTSPGVNVV
ncbi:MAG: DUF1540 domain-containing protein, partial [Coriobacteriia bacterium]